MTAYDRRDAVVALLFHKSRMHAALLARTLPISAQRVVVGRLTPYRDDIWQAAVELGFEPREVAGIRPVSKPRFGFEWVYKDS